MQDTGNNVDVMDIQDMLGEERPKRKLIIKPAQVSAPAPTPASEPGTPAVASGGLPTRPAPTLEPLPPPAPGLPGDMLPKKKKKNWLDDVEMPTYA